MDILRSHYYSDKVVRQLIAENELKYESRKIENDDWRKWLSIEGNSDRLKEFYPDVDVNAAFISCCRSDVLSCGACALRHAIHELDKLDKE